jgi:multidrug transporter EmrE-like cation transporter
MNLNGNNLLAVYALLIMIGLTSGAGDIMLYKWARSSQSGWLMGSYASWFSSVALLGLLFRMEHFSFGAAVVLATMIHLAIGVFWGFLFTGSKISTLELAGLILAIIAVIMLEVGRSA